MLMQFQKDMISRVATDRNAIFAIYSTALLMLDMDTADYLLEQGLTDDFTDEQIEELAEMMLTMQEQMAA